MVFSKNFKILTFRTDKDGKLLSRNRRLSHAQYLLWLLAAPGANLPSISRFFRPFGCKSMMENKKKKHSSMVFFYIFFRIHKTTQPFCIPLWWLCVAFPPLRLVQCFLSTFPWSSEKKKSWIKTGKKEACENDAAPVVCFNEKASAWGFENSINCFASFALFHLDINLWRISTKNSVA